MATFVRRRGFYPHISRLVFIETCHIVSRFWMKARICGVVWVWGERRATYFYSKLTTNECSKDKKKANKNRRATIKILKSAFFCHLHPNMSNCFALLLIWKSNSACFMDTLGCWRALLKPWQHIYEKRVYIRTAVMLNDKCRLQPARSQLFRVVAITSGMEYWFPL